MPEEASLQKAREQALSYLSRKEHSAREVESYLLRKGYDIETAAGVTWSLAECGAVDDQRLAEMVIAAAPARGWGRSRVRQELLRRGIDREEADEALRRFYPEEDLSLALSLAKKRWSACKGDERRREASLAGYLARRGFSTSTVVRVLSEMRDAASSGEGAG